MTFTFRPVLTLFAAAGIAMLVSLGVWQLKRHQWKQNLIEAIDARMRAEPVSLISANELWSGNHDTEYLRVVQGGVFRHDLETHVFGSTKGAAGFYVFTPLALPESEWAPDMFVYVNRGFIPQRLKDQENRKDGQIEGQVRVEGSFRAVHEPRGVAATLQPANDQLKNIWHRRDPLAFAEAAGIKALPIYVDSLGTENPANWPAGGAANVEFSNRHFGYVLTWFGLATALFGVWLAHSLKKR